MVDSMAESAHLQHDQICTGNICATTYVLKSNGITTTMNIVISVVHKTTHMQSSCWGVSHTQHAMVPFDLPISNSFELEKGSWVVDGPLVNGVSTRKIEKVYILLKHSRHIIIITTNLYA